MRVLLDECVDWRLSRDIVGHDLVSFDLAVIVLGARSNRIADLRLLVPDLLAALNSCKPGSARFVGSTR